ncbi:hypothetical protein DVH05_001794 [Phytophthora capsici]|nr:hypothetical protein DVH05_001794 [Phytophthora capsici]
MKCFLNTPNSQCLSHNVIFKVVQRKKRYNDVSSNVRLQPRQILSETQWCPEVVKTKEIEELLQLGQKLEQERRRVNQARYRKKQNDRVLTLEKETKQLQQQIEKLIERKRVKTSSIHPKGTFWDVAIEYIHLFGKPSAKDFLNSTMTFDVEFNSEYGVESILRNWSYLSWWFKDLEVELETVTKTSPETLVASTTTSFTITKDTLSRVFPNLVNNSALTSKLLGQRVTIQGWTVLQWDDTVDLVTRVNSESDLLSPMLRLLGSLEDVSVVFDEALVTLDFQVRKLNLTR